MKLGSDTSDHDWIALCDEISELVGENYILRFQDSAHFRYNGNNFCVIRPIKTEMCPDVFEVEVESSNGDFKLYWVESSEELFDILKGVKEK